MTGGSCAILKKLNRNGTRQVANIKIVIAPTAPINRWLKVVSVTVATLEIIWMSPFLPQGCIAHWGWCAERRCEWPTRYLSFSVRPCHCAHVFFCLHFISLALNIKFMLKIVLNSCEFEFDYWFSTLYMVKMRKNFEVRMNKQQMAVQQGNSTTTGSGLSLLSQLGKKSFKAPSSPTLSTAVYIHAFIRVIIKVWKHFNEHRLLQQWHYIEWILRLNRQQTVSRMIH